MADTPTPVEPVSIDHLVEVMSSVGVWWAVAGGWAIDLWLDEQTREHHDIEVVIRRMDQAAVRDALGGEWALSCMDPPGSGWRAWSPAHEVRPPAFQLQAQGPIGVFDLFLESADSESWRYRRDTAVTRALVDVAVVTDNGVPVVRPEVQLLYMAKSTELKNAHDFALAAPRLDSAARAWLVEALMRAHPAHPWLTAL